MKTIHLLRHAKSSWDDDSLPDRERPLASRGIQDCARMGRHILETGCGFRNVFASPARRAWTTIKLVSEGLTGIDVHWKLDEELYTFGSSCLLHWLAGLDDRLDEVMMVGHNPGFTDLCNRLGDRHVTNIPTCGYARLAGDVSSWRDVAGGGFKLVSLLIPKELK